ncbi:hypothetical protein [Sulfurimonas marina]|uniref:Uncharacterized protein n=1 Tax=Sulfurimonas marina TaxID=2590551 RepID=A0A7M1ATC8_9BACT|nr:hypothetical protein [Sulfurimonas marina]QOP40650.1 hypothetical protein FJR03_02385 [Sulfurimonas marina]
MKKFNLFKEIIIVDKQELLSAVNSQKEFAITTKGEIVFTPLADKTAVIYVGQHIPKPASSLSLPKPTTLAEILGQNYQIVEDEERVLIKAFSNWQNLIAANVIRASYDDTTGDGVGEFSNKELETMGWHATEFNITYRELVELIEERCEGILLCIEQEEPQYQFSGLGFIEDDEQAQEIVFEYCQQRVKKMIAEDELYAKDNLSDDEEEAAQFFKAL